MRNSLAAQKKHIRGNLMQYISPLAVVVLIITFRIISKSFLSTRNIRNLLEDVGPLLIASCGVSFVLLLGSIDLSVGNVISCTCIMMAVTMRETGFWSYPMVIVYGVFTGVLNGWLFTRFQVPSFIVTMATMSIWARTPIPAAMAPEARVFTPTRTTAMAPAALAQVETAVTDTMAAARAQATETAARAEAAEAAVMWLHGLLLE